VPAGHDLEDQASRGSCLRGPRTRRRSAEIRRRVRLQHPDAPSAIRSAAAGRKILGANGRFYERSGCQLNSSAFSTISFRTKACRYRRSLADRRSSPPALGLAPFPVGTTGTPSASAPRFEHRARRREVVGEGVDRQVPGRNPAAKRARAVRHQMRRALPVRRSARRGQKLCRAGASVAFRPAERALGEMVHAGIISGSRRLQRPC